MSGFRTAAVCFAAVQSAKERGIVKPEESVDGWLFAVEDVSWLPIKTII